MRVWGLLAMIVLLAGALITGCSRINRAVNSSSQGNSNAPANARNNPPDNVRRVTITELRDMLAQDKAIVIDVRGDTAYNQEHIKGALDIPEAQLVSRSGEFPKDKLIVLYCS
jgi:3-mercaptopyruvate sulfurtransferase SseA